ncbi:Glycosyltransferase involved in cell wall bisynthesis [Tangfeifania diversioriginum]|uniref:Glycosyltransferase involved in cell wall bisynthesis n=1 Tax=Tangfeifania diversioriginum TaxID=1168035 RepID=A0A1M6HRR5_9BACT|nr:glycosyltransferase family 1 protein [Tangfeifania diversioriginum]SHJ24853.1 Glycosyltransferase involved in cell wall bisynthesis [Tangfeifania diversioriginum]
MVIAVNTRLLIEDKLEGIGWFTFETLKRITQNHPQHQFIFIFDRPYNEKFIFAKNITPVVISPPTRHPVLWYFWFEFRIPGILKKYKADLFLSPDGYLSLNTKTPQLAVIHDINFVHRPKDLPWLKAKYYNYFFPKFAREATRIATVSNYSKKDITHSFTIDEEKIDVVYNGINTAYTPTPPGNQKATRKKYTSGSEYFLFVGALHPRKNITGLLEAFDTFKVKDKKGIKLLIVGGQMHKTGKISETYKNMQFKNDVVFTGRVPTSKLHSILGAALALTFIPFFEGFGIPVVEAMSAGVPVICSNTTSLPEVGGEAVIYVDPNNSGQISDAMKLLAGNSEKRNELIQKGFIQKEKFSWGKTAKLLWKSIEKAIADKY